jgi:hypothetical protein
MSGQTGIRSMASMIVRYHGKSTSSGQACETCVPGAVFPESVKELDYASHRTIGLPVRSVYCVLIGTL